MDSENSQKNFTFYVTQLLRQGHIIPNTLYNCEIFNKK